MKVNYIFNPATYENFIRLSRAGIKKYNFDKWGMIHHSLSFELSFTEKEYPSHFDVPLITDRKRSLGLDEKGHSDFTSAVFNVAFIQELEDVYQTKIKTPHDIEHIFLASESDIADSFFQYIFYSAKQVSFEISEFKNFDWIFDEDRWYDLENESHLIFNLPQYWDSWRTDDSGPITIQHSIKFARTMWFLHKLEITSTYRWQLCLNTRLTECFTEIINIMAKERSSKCINLANIKTSILQIAKEKRILLLNDYSNLILTVLQEHISKYNMSLYF